MKKTICIYHGNCADGFGAAYAVWKKYGDEEVEYYPGIYGGTPPDVTDRDVIMVDFSYSREVVDRMAEQSSSLLILDHHKSAAEALAGYALSPEMGIYNIHNWLNEDSIILNGAIFDMERSGAMIAWEFFHPGEEIPQLIHHIQDRDLWRFDLKATRDIQAALFSYPYDFKVWGQFMRLEYLVGLERDGVAINRKHFKDIDELIESAAQRAVIAGYDVPVLNAPYFYSSDAGAKMAKGEPFAACYWDTPDGRAFSLRSDKDGEDVSEIAKLFGGGGHKHAAGFRLNVSPQIVVRPEDWNK